MGKIKALIKLLRPTQYYKNALVFLGAIFSGILLDWTYWPLLILGFISFCMISSSNYIINDIIDMKKDKLHEEKKNRPLPSGEIPVWIAIVLFIIFLLVPIGIGFYISYYIVFNYWFLLFIILVFFTGQVYNLYFKRISVVDILTLSLNYIWRALAGCILINELASPWLTLSVFLGALFLVLCKRRNDLALMGEAEAHKHKEVYEIYTIQLLDQMITAATAALLVDYCIYSLFKFLYEDVYLLMTLPIFFYVVFRYLSLVYIKEGVARKTERAFLDKGIIIGGIVLIIMVILVLYFPSIFEFIADLPAISTP